MTGYTYEMFCEDHDELSPMLKVLKNLDFPEDQWPQLSGTPEIIGKDLGFNTEFVRETISKFKKMGLMKEEITPRGTIYRLNPNSSTADTIGAFKIKYGEKATDYAMRFLSIMWFINNNREALMKKDLVRNAEGGGSLVDEDMVKTMLESFRSSVPPSIFPTSALWDKNGNFKLSRVIKELRKKKPGPD
jgi:hypothetical protein